MDLCKEKNFIDLEGKIHLNEKNNRIVSIIDAKDNIWALEKKISEGTTGEVYLYKSCNDDQVNLAIKYFIAEDEEAEADMKQEVHIVELFNKHRCHNFIRAGTKDFKKGEKVIIMEEIDGDLTDLDFTLFSKPLKLYKDLINFIADASICALKKDKLFLDMKSENIGFKICNNGIKFTFIDLGSFFDIDADDIMATFYINYDKFREYYFSNEVTFVYSVIMTLLNIRLQIENINYYDKFITYHLDQMGNEKKYTARKRGLLSDKNYKRIKKRFEMYLKKEERFIKYLFKCLEDLTEEKPNVSAFLEGLLKHNNY